MALSKYSLIFSLLILAACQHKKSYTSWDHFGGSPENIHYSSLQQIDTNNVTQLQVAWTYHTGDADTVHKSQIQCNPIIIDGVLYGTTPQMKLFAINAASGKEVWVFNPFDSISMDKKAFFVLNNCRGVAYWSDNDKDKRLFYTAGSYLFCINATNGKPITAFGDAGKIDLHDGLERNVADLFVTATSPGLVYNDLIVMGTRVDEGPSAAPGHIRAYDVHTGKQRWIFHTIPYPGEYGYNTWDDTAAYKHIGGANAWSGFSLDKERGILFASTGSASFDFYGGKRTGANLFADCLLALDATTGKRIWHFQEIHHDVWDKDLPTPPALVTLTKNGKSIDAVAQPTKTGFIFLLERATGKPVYPIEERKVPQNTTLVNEKLWATQPIPTLPQPFARQSLTENDLNPYLPDSSYADVKKRFASYLSGNMFNAPSHQGTVIFPGYDGGAEWGGPSFDPQSGLLYVNANEMAWILTIVDLKQDMPKQETNLTAGMRLYQSNCLSCHGPDRKGSGNYPSLVDIEKKYSSEQFYHLINSGRRMMPAFRQLSDEERQAIASYVLNLKKEQKGHFIAPAKEGDPYAKLPYTTTGYNKFLSKEGYPAIKPPWGTLNAIDLNSGRVVWKNTLGDYPELAAKGIHTGTENYGGSVVTAGGVLFIAATKDSMFRCFNKRDGRLLWQTKLPAPGFATPALYEVAGREYVVIACGGGKLGTASSDAYVAFALPKKSD